MEFVREVGDKGQVVIPKDIRILLGIKERSRIVFEISNKEVKIKKKDSKKILEEFFTIARTKRKDITLEELKKIEDESYDLP